MRRGLSLVESIFATLMLMVALLVVFQLFHYGMRYFSWVEQKTLALAVAEKRLAELRNWARTQNNWAGYPNGPDPDYPNYQVVVTLTNYTLASPGQQVDSNFVNKRELTTTAKQARVKVIWPRGNVELTSILVDRGNRGWSASNPLTIQGSIPATVTEANPGVPLTVDATDAAGQPLQDLFFRWYVEANAVNGATGTITPTRDGRSAVFTNRTLRADGTFMPATGQCKVAVRAIYNGQERWARTGTINLAP